MPKHDLACPHLADLTPYQSARRIGGSGDVWLNANESPYPREPMAMNVSEYHRYPDRGPGEVHAAYARYAGALRLLKLVFVELEPVECRVLAHMLPARAYEDLTGQQRAVESFRSETLTKASNTVYDGYLRSQGVTAGRGDYDRAADLLIRAWKAEVLSLN